MPKYTNRNSVLDKRGRSKSGSSIELQIFDEKVVDADKNERAKISYEEVDLDLITPRSVNNYSQTRIDRLASSILKTGGRLIHPIVLVRAADLPEDGEVIKRFREQGIDTASLKYVIVAGERRYRAFLRLREQARQKNEELAAEGFITDDRTNYDTITANILSKKEALKESIFYSDSNTEARQLTPLEGILHIKDAKGDVERPEEQLLAYYEMNDIEGLDGFPSKEELEPYSKKASGKEYPFTPEQEVSIKRKFNLEKYCEYYLDKELGIEDWSAGKIKKYLSVLNNCDEKVVKAVLFGSIQYQDAFNLRKIEKEEQLEILSLLYDKEGKVTEEGKARFKEAIRALEVRFQKEKESKKRLAVSKYSSATARRKARDINRDLKNRYNELSKITSQIGGETAKSAEGILKKMKALINELEEFSETKKTGDE